VPKAAVVSSDDCYLEDTDASRPLALDLFSGPRAPVASALAWLGWRVQAVDTCFGTDHDLSDRRVQAQVSDQLSRCDAQFWAPACDTITRAREIPVHGHGSPPAPLQSACQVRGVPGLAAKDSSRVAEAN